MFRLNLSSFQNYIQSYSQVKKAEDNLEHNNITQ